MTAPQDPSRGYGPGSYGPAAYGPGPHGAPGYGYGYGPRQVEHPQGTIVLILGILGIVTCPVLGPIAWTMGNKALAEIDADPARYSNRGAVTAGRICGIVGSVIIGLYVVLFGVAFLLPLLLAVSGSGS